MFPPNKDRTWTPEKPVSWFEEEQAKPKQGCHGHEGSCEFSRVLYIPDTTNGTAIGLPISWGGARGVNVGINSYKFHTWECMGYSIFGFRRFHGVNGCNSSSCQGVSGELVNARFGRVLRDVC